MPMTSNNDHLVMPDDLDGVMHAVADGLDAAGNTLSDLGMMLVVARRERDALAAALERLTNAVQGNSTWAVDDAAQAAALEALEVHQENAKTRPAPYLKDADA